jgi:3-methyladenine DNA glycosylase AlkD
MASIDVTFDVKTILSAYDPSDPAPTAEALQALWLRFDPNRTPEAFTEAQRAKQKVVGIPIPVLKAIAKEVGKAARKRVDDYLPLMQLLWDAYGREGRVVALIPLGKMELVAPERIIPGLRSMCPTCVTWEDADRLAMDALEPIVRKAPEVWLSEIEPWLDDDNTWVQRAGITVIGRLAMKKGDYAERCLELIEPLLSASDTDVKRAVSYAMRVTARGDAVAVRDFLARHLPPDDPAATWALCDAIRSMSKRLLPAFAPLLPDYEAWAADPNLDSVSRRSIESAVRTLKKAAT